MADNQAGVKPSKMPWEAGFWGDGTDVPAPQEKAPVAPSKGSVRPWEAGFWKKSSSAVVALPSKNLNVVPDKKKSKAEKQMTKDAIIHPNEVMPDTQSLESNLAEIDKEIKNAKTPEQIAILKDARAKIIQRGRL